MEEIIKDENFKVRLQNFQSIEAGEIQIPVGLTIVTGDTNQGKTAIIRAVDCAMWNTGTDDMVKAGTKIAGVTISNGKHEMVYCRNSQGKNEKTAYQFDGGTVQRKVGRAQLPEVISMFGIRDVRMQNGIKMKLNFWYQNEKPFLTDRTAGQLYEFLSLSSCDKYVKVLKQMVTDIKVQEAEINNSNVKIDTLKVLNNRKQEFIDKNAGFDDVYKRVIVASDRVNKVNESIKDLNDIQDISDNIEDSRSKLRTVNERLDKVDIDSLTKSYNELLSLNEFYTNAYEDLCEIKALKDEIQKNKDDLKEVSKKYKTFSDAEQNLSSKCKALIEGDSKYSSLYGDAVECVKCKKEIDSIKNRIISIDDNSIDIDSIENSLNSLIRLKDSYDSMSGTLSDLVQTKESMKKLGDSIADIDDKIKSSEEDLEKYKLEVGYCPFCGSVFRDCEHSGGMA